jgi:hypothetical protein
VVWEFGSVAQPWRRCSRAQASPIGLARERVCSGSPCRRPQGQGARTQRDIDDMRRCCPAACLRPACRRAASGPAQERCPWPLPNVFRSCLAPMSSRACSPNMPPIAALRQWQWHRAIRRRPTSTAPSSLLAAGLESYPLTHCTSFVARRCSDTMRLAAATLGA